MGTMASVVTVEVEPHYHKINMTLNDGVTFNQL